MITNALPDMFTLKALAHDAEAVTAILEFPNGDPQFEWNREWGRSFVRNDVVDALMRLVRDDSVRAYVGSPDAAEWVELPVRQLPVTSFDQTRFSMTGRGTVRYLNWDS